MGALASDGEALAVADALQAADLDLALDVALHLTAQIALNLEVLIDVRADLIDLALGQVGDLGIWIDFEIGTHLLRCGQSDSKDVSERNLKPLLAGDVDAGNTCHLYSSSALPLLVTGVSADDHDTTVATNHLAVVAHRFDAWSYFHGFSLLAVLFVSVRDATPSEVVWGEFHLHLVAGENANVVHPHLSGDVRQDCMAVFEFDLEHCVRQRFEDRAFQHDRIFLGLWQGLLLTDMGHDSKLLTLRT